MSCNKRSLTLSPWFWILVSLKCCLMLDCHDGWTRYQNSCYLLVDHVTDNWGGAENYCHLLSGYLLEIENRDKNNFIVTWLHGRNITTQLWIGGNDIESEGVYVWTKSHTRFGFTYWAHGEPNNKIHNEDCVAILPENLGYRWNDAPCDGKYHFVCENRLNEGVQTIVG